MRPRYKPAKKFQVARARNAEGMYDRKHQKERGQETERNITI